MLRSDTRQTVAATDCEILIVDDEAAIRLALREYLAHRGFAVTCAGEVEEAEALLSTHRYSVAIVDLQLSGSCGQTGLSVLSGIREKSPDTRTVLLSAHISPEAERAASSLGVDAVLHKPTPLSEVAAIVGELIGQQSFVL